MRTPIASPSPSRASRPATSASRLGRIPCRCGVRRRLRTATATATARAERSEVLHQGIAARAFERRFQLLYHVKVTAANLENGLLHIDLVREVPEAQKPRTIQINVADNAIDVKPTESRKAA